MKKNILLNIIVAILLALPMMWLIHIYTPKYTGNITIEFKKSSSALAFDITKDGKNERFQFENINGKEQLYCEVWSENALIGVWQEQAHLIKNTVHHADINKDGIDEIIYFSVENDSIFANSLSFEYINETFHAKKAVRIFMMPVAGPDFDIYSFQSDIVDLNNDGIPELVANINQGATIRGIYCVNFSSGLPYKYDRHFIHFTNFNIVEIENKKCLLVTSYANGNIPDTKLKLAAKTYGADTNQVNSYRSDWQSYLVLLDHELKPLCEPKGFGIMFSMQRAIQRRSDGKFISLQSGISDEDTIEVIRLFNQELELIKETPVNLEYDKSRMTKYYPYILYQIGEGENSKIIYVNAHDTIMEIDPVSLKPKFYAYFPEVKNGADIREFDLDKDGINEIIFSVDNGILVTQPDLKDPIFLTTEGKISSIPKMKYTFENEATQGVRVISDKNHYLISYKFNRWWYWKWFFIPLNVLILFIILFTLQRIQSRKLEAKNQHLETVVKERTREITHQKEMIEEKQKEILDSITYAKRIQEAILPSRYSLVENLKNGFVLYKPKDIVAGDFYWLEFVPANRIDANASEEDKYIYFAAADCTGHGVPGAMVSVICSNALSKSLLEEGIYEPGKILDRTRELVVDKLSKSGEEVKDGMDAALCALQVQGSMFKVKYSGANNPLWLIRQTNFEPETLNFELIEYKANKQPIGKYADPKPFTTHEIDLQKGDTIYIFTDGFQDQFGGEKGKKLKAKAFKELLLSIQDKSMDDQREIIDETFEKWRGNLEQNDDVCVIGVRI